MGMISISVSAAPHRSWLARRRREQLSAMSLHCFFSWKHVPHDILLRWNPKSIVRQTWRKCKHSEECLIICHMTMASLHYMHCTYSTQRMLAGGENSNNSINHQDNWANTSQQQSPALRLSQHPPARQVPFPPSASNAEHISRWGI